MNLKKLKLEKKLLIPYFDAKTTPIGTPNQIISRRRKDVVATNINLATGILNELVAIVNQLNIRRKAVIK